jgi:hypothetical protein
MDRILYKLGLNHGACCIKGPSAICGLLAEGDGVTETIGLAVGDGVATGEAVGDGVGETVGFKGTPWLQTSFLPDFTQVYLKFSIILVVFIFGHLVPAIVAECAGKYTLVNSAKTIEMEIDNLRLSIFN